MFASALSVHPDARVALGEVLGEVYERIGAEPDLAVIFLTEAHVGAAGHIARTVQELLAPKAFIGTSASAVLGGGQGIENRPGLVLWAARTRHAVRPFALRATVDGDDVRLTGLDPSDLDGAPTMLLLADPFSFPAQDFLDGMTRGHPGVAVVGGLASAARSPGGNVMVLGGEIQRSGAVGVLLDAAESVEPVVSQGCRPIGAPFTVTRASGNLVEEIAGRPALERLRQIVAELDDTDRALVATGLHVGIVADEHRYDFGRGDFLIRGVLGADQSGGAIAVSDIVEVGTTIQFQVRDPATAGDDLRLLLLGHPSDAALVFTCNGRGTSMFGDPHHDAQIVEDHLGHAPIAGMFCAGEFGPVGRRNALHGFTAAVALFRN